jgi:hypothetical protein
LGAYYVRYIVFAVWDVKSKPRVSHLLGKCSTTELHFQFLYIVLSSFVCIVTTGLQNKLGKGEEEEKESQKSSQKFDAQGGLSFGFLVFLYFTVLGFEFRILLLLGRCYTA